MIRADFSVTKEHGTFIEKNGILFMGTFHPAALLRQPQNKPEAFGDFVACGIKYTGCASIPTDLSPSTSFLHTL